MDVSFSNNKLDRLDADSTYTAGFSPSVVRAFRMRMQSFRASPDESALEALKSLDVQENGRPDRRLIRLDSETRLVVDFRDEGDRTVLQVVGIQNGKQTGRRAK